MSARITAVTPKPARHSKTIVTFGVTLTTALVSLILHYTGALVLPAEALGGALSTVVASAVGLILRYRTSAPLARKARKRPSLPPSGTTWLVLALLVMWVPLHGCGAAWEATSEKAGWCVARCAAGCAGSWIGDLINSGTKTSVASMDFTRDPNVIRAGSRLHYAVPGPDGKPVVYSGRLQGAPLVDGRHRAGYFIDDDGGPARLVLLSPEPRLYCASLGLLPEALPAVLGYAPKDPPRSREDFERRFGPLPVFP